MNWTGVMVGAAFFLSAGWWFAVARKSYVGPRERAEKVAAGDASAELVLRSA